METDLSVKMSSNPMSFKQSNHAPCWQSVGEFSYLTRVDDGGKLEQTKTLISLIVYPFPQPRVRRRLIVPCRVA